MLLSEFLLLLRTKRARKERTLLGKGKRIKESHRRPEREKKWKEGELSGNGEEATRLLHHA